jgi:cytochrome c556
MNAKTRVGGLVGAVAITFLIGSIADPRAQQPPAQGSQGTQGAQGASGAPGGTEKPAGQAAPPEPATGPLTPTKALVPVAASSLASNPDAYVGEFVTMTGTVEQSLTTLAFSVDQDATKPTGKEVLVLAPRMNGAVDPNTYVTVIGLAVKFDPAVIASKSKNYNTDLPADVAAKFKDRPTILATAVINGASVDLAKWLPPPMSPDETAFDKVMKGVQPAFGALRKGADGSNLDLVKPNAATLIKSFAETEAFMKRRDLEDAEKWAEDARKMVEAIDKSAATGQWDAVKASATNLQKACAQCHGAYRLRGEDGTFYIKPKDGKG